MTKLAEYLAAACVALCVGVALHGYVVEAVAGFAAVGRAL